MFQLCAEQKDGLMLLFTSSDGKFKKERLIVDDADVTLFAKFRFNHSKYEYESTISKLCGKSARSKPLLSNYIFMNRVKFFSDF